MGILFRGHRALKEQNLKILKRQYGGVIPFYASYTYKETPTVPYNPSTLLAKYQGTPAAQTKASDNGDKKKLDLDIDALPNDAARFGDEYLGLMAQIEQGERENLNFKNTKAGQILYSRADMYSTVKINDLKRRREAYDKAVTNIYEKNNSSDTWVVQNGLGFVSGIDPETEERRFDWIPLADIQKPAEEGAIQWRPVSYKDALSFSANSTDTDLSYNLDFTLRLNEGIGMNKVLTDYIDPLFKDIGKNATGRHIEVGGQEITLDDGTKKAISQIVSGRKDITNVPHLHKAFSTMLKQLQGTPAYNTLLGEAYKNTTTPEEADEWMLQYLVAQVEKRYDITGEYTEIDKEDLEKTWKIQGRFGSESGPVKVLSKYTDAWAGLTNQSSASLEFPVAEAKGGRLKYDPEAKTSMTTVTAYDAAEANALWNHTITNKNSDGEVVKTAVPLADQKGFEKVAVMQEAILPDGTKLKDLEWNFGDTYKMNGLQAMVPSNAAGTKVVTLPIDKRTGGVVKLKNQDQFNKEYKAIQDRRSQDRAAQSGSAEANARYDTEIEELENKYLKDYQGLIEYKKFYMVEAVYNNYAAPTKVKNMKAKDASGDEVQAYNNAFVAEIDKTGYFDDVDQAEYFSRQTILIPAKNALAHQRADDKASVYVEQPNVMGGTLGSNPGNQTREVTNEEILQAIKNQNSWNTTDYNSRKGLY